MTLSQFDVSGEGITDDETEEVIRKGDPRRSLIAIVPMAARCTSTRG